MCILFEKWPNLWCMFIAHLAGFWAKESHREKEREGRGERKRVRERGGGGGGRGERKRERKRERERERGGREGVVVVGGGIVLYTSDFVLGLRRWPSYGPFKCLPHTAACTHISNHF